jgi:hypothetical protein
MDREKILANETSQRVLVGVCITILLLIIQLLFGYELSLVPGER